MTPTAHSIYFIAVIPPEPIQSEVTDFKQAANNLFGSAHALKSPPHITLIPPFRAGPSQIGKISQLITGFCTSASAFAVILNGFAAFKPRVIFVRIVENPKLTSLRNRLINLLTVNQLVKISDRRPFHAHMTIAFRDLARSQFKSAYTHFREIEYHRKFFVEKIHLLEHKTGKWKVIKSFDLGMA